MQFLAQANDKQNADSSKAFLPWDQG